MDPQQCIPIPSKSHSYLYPIIGKYACGSLGISSPGIGTHFFPIFGGKGGNPLPLPVCNPEPRYPFPSGNFSSTELSVGTSEVTIALSAWVADETVTADAF
jgi:hypothetical protein